MKRTFFYFSILVVVIAAMVAGCTPAAQPPPAATTGAPSAPAADKPQYGGTLKILSSIGPVNMGVPYEPGSPPDIIYGLACVETLLRLDEKGMPIPWLATEWKLSPDKKALTLSLRKGVKFHDGTDFNAEAVKYLLDLYKAGPQPELKAVQSIEIVDDYTVKLNLTQFQSNLIPSLSLRPGIMVSPTSLKTNGKEYHYTHPVGTGPFKYTEFKRDSIFKVNKFDGYWQKGKPYLDSIEQVIVADPTVAIMSFESGEAMGINTDPETASRLKQTGKYIVTSTPNAVACISGDSANPDSPFSKLQVRQAISYAINNEQIAKLGFGFWQPAKQLATPANWFYDPSTAGYPYNPAKAKELLAQAGYPNGFKTKLSYAATSSVAKPSSPVMQANLRDVGIEVELDPLANPAFIQLRNKGWGPGALIQATLLANVGSELGSTLLASLSSKSTDYIKIIHPEDYDSKLLQSLAEPDLDKRKAMYQEVMKLAVDKYCLVNPVVITQLLFVKSPKVHDIRMVEYWYSQWTPEDAWISK